MPEYKDMNDMFKKMADAYVEQYGEELKAEMEQLEKGEPTRITPAMDEKVHTGIRRIKRARNRRVWGIAAACILVAVFIPIAVNIATIPRQLSLKSAEEATMFDYGAESLPNAEAQPAEEPAAQAPAVPAPVEPLPLSTDKLPNNFTVADVQMDVGKTIYHIENTELDDVVLTMEQNEALPELPGYRELDINGNIAYAQYNSDYSMLVFLHEGVLYELSCKYDANTLVQLGEGILA